jgi:hypothetical protein
MRVGWTFEPPRDCKIKYDNCVPVGLYKPADEEGQPDERWEIKTRTE